MPGFEEQEAAVSRVYAQAMLELAERGGQTETLLEELEDLVSYLDRDPGFERFLSDPRLDVEARGAALEKLLRGRASDLLTDSLLVINRKERLGLLRSIAAAFRHGYEMVRGIVEVGVVTAVPLSDEIRSRLVEAASRFTGKRAELRETVDPSLIGGMVVRAGDQKVDSSVQRELEKLRLRFLDRASHEIHSRRAYLVEE